MTAAARAGLDPASAECALASLVLRPSPERLARLRASVRAAVDWEGLIAHVESHGVLGLFRRNLELAGISLPPAASALLAERARVLQQDGERFRFTLGRFLAEAEARGLRPILLKGSSLALDLYPDPWLRSQGDIDLLVEERELGIALRAAAAAGLAEGIEALPGWWYRLAHFHRKLRPSTALLREVELHWALHPPSLLLTVPRPALAARSRDAGAPGFPARTLDPLDRFLHLVTHLASHARGSLGPHEPASLLAWLADRRSAIRFKWIVDVHGEWERRAPTWTAAALLERAREWNAETQLADVLGLIHEAWGFEGPALELARETLAALPFTAPPARPSQPRGELLAGLDFRPSALRGLLRWIVPPRRYLERRYGARSGPAVLGWRAVHAGRVVIFLGFSLLALPAALVGRAWLRPRRARELEAATTPEKALDLAVAWRCFLAEETELRAGPEAEREASFHS